MITRLFVCGPLPPPHGGARNSFALFLYELKRNAQIHIDHVDLPVRHQRSASPPGRVDHIGTLRLLLKSMFRIRSADRVIVFGSANFCFSYGILMLLIAKILNKPSVIRFFGGNPLYFIQRTPSILKALLLKLISNTEKIVVQTHRARSMFPAAMRRKTQVVPGYRESFAPSSLIKARPEKAKVRFVYAGSINKAKGVATLLEAFENVFRQYGQTVELAIYGSGEASLIKRVRETQGVVYAGYVKNGEMRKALLDFDAVVLPTRYALEGHPGIVVEGLVSGIPAIVGDHPSVLEIIHDGINGLVVDAQDASSLAGAMSLFIRDKAMRERLSRAALLTGRNYDARIVLPTLFRTVLEEV